MWIFGDLFQAAKEQLGLQKKMQTIPYPSTGIVKAKGLPVVTFTDLGHYGELGNQMFQVATVIGYANKHNFRVKLPYWYCKLSNSDYSGIFRNKVDQSLRSRDLVSVYRFEYLNLDYIEIPTVNTPIDLAGYFQSENYFLHCADEIKKIFEPNAEIDRYITTKYADVLRAKKKVAVQIRTGKRTENDHGGHAYASKDFLEHAFRYYDDDNLFVIFADSMERAKGILPKGKKYFFVEQEKNYVDLFFMNKFSNYIISPSTFGWWGAWLSESEKSNVVIMGDWFEKDGSKRHLNKNNIIPDRWTKI